MIIALIVINFIVVSIILNILQSIYMKIVGASVMFFDGGKKFVLILVISLMLAAAGL